MFHSHGLRSRLGSSHGESSGGSRLGVPLLLLGATSCASVALLSNLHFLGSFDNGFTTVGLAWPLSIQLFHLPCIGLQGYQGADVEHNEGCSKGIPRSPPSRHYCLAQEDPSEDSCHLQGGYTPYTSEVATFSVQTSVYGVRFST